MANQDERRLSGLCVLDALAALRHPKPLLGAGIAAVLVGVLLSSFFLQGPAVQLAWLVPFSLSLAFRSFVESFLELLLFQLSSIPLVLWTAAAISGASSRSPAMRKHIGRSNAVLLRDVAGVSVVMALGFAAINTLYWAPHWPRQDGLTITLDLGYVIRALPPIGMWFVAFLALSGVVLYGQKPLRALRHAVELGRRRWKDATALLIVLLVGSYLAAWLQYPFYHGVHVGFLTYWTLLILPPGALVAYVVLTAVCLLVAEERIIMSQPRE
jgi:hypothetical protein